MVRETIYSNSRRLRAIPSVLTALAWLAGSLALTPAAAVAAARAEASPAAGDGAGKAQATESASAASAAAADPVIAEVLRMLRGGVAAPVVVLWLDKSGKRPAAVGSGDLLALHEAGASDELLKRLIQLAGGTAPAVAPAASAAAPKAGAASAGAAAAPAKADAAPARSASPAPAKADAAPASAAAGAPAKVAPGPAGSPPASVSPVATAAAAAPSATAPAQAVAAVAPAPAAAQAPPPAAASSPALAASSSAAPAQSAGAPVPAASATSPAAAGPSAAAPAAPSAAALVKTRFAVTYRPVSVDDESQITEPWWLLLYVDGRVVASVKPAPALLPLPPRTFDLELAPGRHLLRVAQERHRLYGTRRGYASGSRVDPSEFPFELEPGGAAQVTVHYGEKSFKHPGPIAVRVEREGREVARFEPSALGAETWPPVCEDVEAAVPAGGKLPSAARQDLAKCVHWAALWPGIAAIPSRDEVRAEVERLVAADR